MSSPPGSQSFPKSRRLRKRVEFQRVYDHGARLHGACFAVFCRRSEQPGPGRVGLTVSRRVGGAVVRNRVRRCLREWIRRHWGELPDDCEVVFHVYPAIVRASAAELEKHVARAFHECSRALRSGRDRRPAPSRTSR